MSISNEVRDRVRADAQNRCGYCLSPQRLILGWLEVEHLCSRAQGGSDEENNLWLACRMCNNYKSSQTGGSDPESGDSVPLFNPRVNHWADHFQWSDDGLYIVGRTPVGRATQIALQMNNPIALMVRREWIGAGWHPPND